jgi:hypothetical protein
MGRETDSIWAALTPWVGRRVSVQNLFGSRLHGQKERHFQEIPKIEDALTRESLLQSYFLGVAHHASPSHAYPFFGTVLLEVGTN